MKFTAKTAKPRNPFVMAAVRRVAGSHRRGAGASRQQHQRDLRQEIKSLRLSP